MPVSPTAQLDALSAVKNPSKADIAGKKIAENFDQFLLLLTTQLKNQDPTAPLDTNAFTQQLVQFASVEQEVAANKNLEKLVTASTQTGVDAGVGYIGQVVETKGNAGFLANNSAPFVYSLSEPASTANIIITDGTGKTVFSGQGDTKLGKNLVNWDGINSFTSETMPDGDYYLTVNAINGSGKKIDVTTSTTGKVSAVEIADGGIKLTVGNLLVPIEDVKAVRESLG